MFMTALPQAREATQLEKAQSARPLIWLCATVIAVGLLPGRGLAEGTGDESTLEEVVVTAQKREQNLQEIGVSVTALQGTELRELGVVDTLQLGSALPNLQLNAASGGNYGAQLTIRGVANTDFSPHQESPNSTYIDEVYVSAPNEQGSTMFDIQRVEDLRGPQGTLFGRNSTGGLISFVTNKPTDQPEGYADVTYGEFNEIRFEAAAGGALADGIDARLAVASQMNDGYDRNYFPGEPDLDGTNFRGIRAALAFNRIDHVKVLLSVSYTHDDDIEGFYGHLNTYFDPNDGGRGAPLPPNINAWGTGPGNDIQGYRSPYVGPEGSVSHDGFLHRGVLSPTLHVDWDLGGDTTFTSISNYTKFLFSYDESCSGAPQFTCQDPYQQDLSQWSEELRLAGASGPLTWVTGLYGLGINQDDGSEFISPYYAGTPFATNTYNPIHQALHSGAIFGQGEYLFSPNWRGTLGLRGTHDVKEFSEQTYLNEEGNFVNTDTVYNPPLLISNFSRSTVGPAATETNTYLTGKAELDYILGKDALLYASVSRGAKGAGFNANEFGANPNNLIPFRGERMLAYEVGEKLTLLEDRVTLNSALFYYDYKDFQSFQYRGNGPNPFVSNDDARFMGGEVELVARPVRGLDVHASISGLSTVVYDVSTAQIGVVNQQAQDAPKWSGNGLVRYSWPLASGTASATWSGDFISGRFHSVDNTPSVYVHGSSGQNIRLGFAQGHWDYGAFVNNVFNNIRETGAFDLTGSYGYTIQTFMPPRWWGVNVRYKF
jgi:iron complex outermembrane recepter protein